MKNVFIALSCFLAGGLCATAQTVHLDLRAEGPGVVSTACPEPHVVGQGFIILAKPLPFARFLGWEDGTKSPERYFVVNASQTKYVANFENIAVVPYFDEHNLNLGQIDPTNRPSATFTRDGGRFRLSFDLAAKLEFKILGCTNLARSAFAPVNFALSSAGPVEQLSATANAGLSTIWVEPPPGSTQSYYMVLLENGVSLPAIFFAQCATAAPNSQVIIYGGGLTGQVAAVTGATTLSATLLNTYSVAVTLPGTPGVYPITIKLNGQPVLGTVTLTVAEAANLPVVNTLTGLTPTPYSTFQLTGKGLATNSLAFIDGTQLQVLDAAPDGTSLLLRLPEGATSGQLRVITAGASSPPISLNVQTDRFSYTPAVTQPIRPYAWDTNSTDRFTYLPTMAPLRVYAWDTNGVERFTYLPVGISAVRVP